MLIEKVLFTKEECNQIIHIKKENPQSWGHIKGRDYKSESIINTEDNGWIFNRYHNFFKETTHLQLKEINNTIHFHTYVVGDLFDRHNDSRDERLYVIGTILNDEYDGGDFIIYNESPIILNKTIGNTYIFKSNLFHEVKEITQGIRYSMIYFLCNNHVKFTTDKLF